MLSGGYWGSPHRSQWIFSRGIVDYPIDHNGFFSRGIVEILLDNPKGILQLFPVWQLAQTLNILVQLETSITFLFCRTFRILECG